MTRNNNNQESPLDEAVQQFVDAQLRGEEPDINEFVKQYPELEHQLREKIQNLQKIDTLFDSIVQADESDFVDMSDEYNLVGKKVGSFEIKEIIGRGGMGVVYLARDIRLERPVAVKSMPAALKASSTAQSRFKREAKLLASLNHPNIAVIHEIVEEEKSGYLILEYIPGQTLAERIARELLNLEEALSIGQQIAEAVSAAHEKSVIHRDLKPGNIKITPDGRVKVLDFGLAKTSGSEVKPVDATATQPGHVMGTPAYMSPEQACGKPTDKRSDIWSFGCIIYQMLTGQLPFEGETATDTLAKIIEREPDWEMLPKETPSNIRVLLRRCLEKNPNRRLRDIGDVAIEIRETLNMPLTAPPVTTPSSTSLKPQVTTRHKLRTAVIIAAALMIALTVIAVQLVSKKEVEPSLNEIRLVVLPFENLGSTEDEYFANGITNAISARLAGIHGLSVISRQSAIQYKKSEKNPQQIGRELHVDYILEGTVQRERPKDPASRIRIIPQLINASENTHVWTEIYDDDMSEVFHLQSNVAERVAQALDIVLIEPERRALASRPTENIEAYEYFMQGYEYSHRSFLEEDFAESGYKLAIKMYERAVELDPGFALAYTRLCEVHCSMYRGYDKSQERLTLAKQAVDKALELNPDLPEAHLALGRYYNTINDFDRALEQFTIARKSQPNNPGTISMIGYIQRKQGNFEQALTSFNKALELAPLGFPLLEYTGQTCCFLHKHPEAERYFNRVISLAPDRPGPYISKAWLYLYWEGSTEKARAVLEKALENGLTENDFIDLLINLDVFDRNYQKALERLSTKSEDIDDLRDFIINNSQQYWRIYTYMDKKDLAKKYYDRARSILESEIKKWPEETRLHGWLGTAYAGLGRKKDAIREGKLAVELASKNTMAVPRRIEELALIYMMVGENDAAIDQLEHLLSIPTPLTIHLIQLDPVWDPLRNHPRFKKLIESGK